MDRYADDFSKIALALTSAQMAKSLAVSEEGVGEDLSTHFLGWNDSALRLICQMTARVHQMPKDEKFNRSAQACAILKKHWWIDSLTMIAEGYCSLDATKTKDMELSSGFLDPSLPIMECITVSHVTLWEDNESSPVSMVASPYRVGIGRTVEWTEPLFYPDRAEQFMRQARYPVMLRRAIELPADEDGSMEKIESARQDLYSLGFNLQEIY